MLKILIIDSDPRAVSGLTNELERQGFQFLACPIESLDGLRTSLDGGRPDIVLSEFNPGGVDGFQALDLVRSRHADVPFIFISQTCDPGLIVEVFENGGNGHIPKRQLPDLRDAILQAQQSCLEQSMPAEPSDIPASTKSGSHQPGEDGFRTVEMVKPICSRCKRIGDPGGDWQPVEIHLRLHTQATVTLGTCPDCARTLAWM